MPAGLVAAAAGAEGSSPGAVLAAMPAGLVAAAQRWWQDEVVPCTTVSGFQHQVAGLLRDLGMRVEVEKLLADGMFSVDLAVHIPGRRAPLAVEAHGPSHYCASDAAAPRLLGEARLRAQLLRARGWDLWEVPYYVWGPLGSAERRRAWVARELQLAGGGGRRAAGPGRRPLPPEVRSKIVLAMLDAAPVQQLLPAAAAAAQRRLATRDAEAAWRAAAAVAAAAAEDGACAPAGAAGGGAVPAAPGQRAARRGAAPAAPAWRADRAPAGKRGPSLTRLASVLAAEEEAQQELLLRSALFDEDGTDHGDAAFDLDVEGLLRDAAAGV
jgi:hypothetical protein